MTAKAQLPEFGRSDPKLWFAQLDHYFIPGCAQLIQHLTNSLKGKPKEFKQTSETVEAIKQLKDKLDQASSLMYRNSLSSVALMVDAPDKAVNGSLNQLVKNSWKSIAFFSKRSASAKIRRSTFRLELLAIYLTIKHFRYVIRVRNFIVFTDHKPLVSAPKAGSDKYSPRKVRYLDHILQSTSGI